jgi:hypothetical protein
MGKIMTMSARPSVWELNINVWARVLVQVYLQQSYFTHIFQRWACTFFLLVHKSQTANFWVHSAVANPQISEGSHSAKLHILKFIMINRQTQNQKFP